MFSPDGFYDVSSFYVGGDFHDVDVVFFEFSEGFFLCVLEVVEVFEVFFGEFVFCEVVGG